MDSLQYVPVSQVATPILGGTPNRQVARYWNGTIKWASAKDIVSADGRFVTQTEECITELGVRESAAKVLPQGTIVITARGTVGAMAMLGEEMSFNQSCYGLVTNRKTTPEYLYYALKASMAGLKAVSYGTVFDTITIKSFDSLRIPLPPLPEQRAVAHILGSLDDKIELNRRTNATLEAIAAALFKSWFVDFDPVRAKAEGRQPYGMDADTAALFPDGFEPSELGEVPRGWRVAQMGEIAELQRASIDPGRYPNEIFYHFSIPAFDEGRMPREDVGASIKSSKLHVPRNAVLLSKLNPAIPRVWYPEVEDRHRAICSTEFLVLVPSSGIERSYLYALLSSPGLGERFTSLVTGTSNSHQRVKPEYLLRLDVLLPPVGIVHQYSALADGLYQRILLNQKESRTLAALRDTLLPKLLSGEVRVTEPQEVGSVAE